MPSGSWPAFIHAEVGWSEVVHVFVLGFYTCCADGIDCVGRTHLGSGGHLVGMNPNCLADSAYCTVSGGLSSQSDCSRLFVLLIVHFRLNPDIWLSPLMIFGTQWYLLFNVIAGASTVPTELRYAAKTGPQGRPQVASLLAASCVPELRDGAITASGGSWNASIVSEYVTWGDTTVQAHGIGSYIAQMTATGISPDCIGHRRHVRVRDAAQTIRRASALRMTEDRMHF